MGGALTLLGVSQWVGLTLSAWGLGPPRPELLVDRSAPIPTKVDLCGSDPAQGQNFMPQDVTIQSIGRRTIFSLPTNKDFAHAGSTNTRGKRTSWEVEGTKVPRVGFVCANSGSLVIVPVTIGKENLRQKVVVHTHQFKAQEILVVRA